MNRRVQLLPRKILVYIPCHSDFNEAIRQAQQLRKDFEVYTSRQARFIDQLEIILSVNNFHPTQKDQVRASQVFDEVSYFGDNLLADVNISEGFLVALRKQPELFWLLSANDSLVEGSLVLILESFEADKDLDLIVANEFGVQQVTLEKEIIKNAPKGYHFGLISGVVYNLKKTNEDFNCAPFLPWTGWSQLAVIQSAMRSNDGLRVLSLPRDALFELSPKQIQHNAGAYAHSFLGGLVLGFQFEKSKRQKRKYLRRFVFRNFYLHHFYYKRDGRVDFKFKLVDPKHYLAWNRSIAEALIKAHTPITYLFYVVCKSIPFESALRSEHLIKIKKRLQTH